MSGDRAVLEHALQRILWELHSYLPDIVIIGGWVPYLHRRYGWAAAWNSALSLTAEVDVLVPANLPAHGRKSLAEILGGAGFKPTSSNDDAAAVWANDPERGEKVEFLVPHSGTIRNLNRVIPIRSQHGVGAISLTALEVMQRHTTLLRVPALSSAGEATTIDLRVPLLGAYLLNKAATFNNRQPPADGGVNLKRAKDLLYLRDVIAAGSEVVQRVEREVDDILREDPPLQHLVDTAVSHVVGVTPADAPALRDAAMMLAERDAMTVDAANADVHGHLLDLSEVLIRFRSQDPASAAEDS